MTKVPDFDYALQNAQLDRRQKMVDALMTGQLIAQQPRAQAGQKGWVSALQGLMPAIHMVAGQYADKGVQKDRQAFTDQADNALRTGMEAFAETSKSDKMKAITDAMASKHPQLRAFAEDQAKRMKENALKPSDLVGISDPTSVLQNQGDTTKWTPKRDVKEVGGILYDANSPDLATKQLGGAGPQTVKIDGDLYEVNPTTKQLKKLDNAPKITVPVSVNTGQKAGMTTFFNNAGKKVDELGTMAQNASNVKQSIAELSNLDSQGIFSNVTSGPATFLANLGEVAGVPVDANKLGNTEAFNAITTDLWQGLVAKFGGNRGVTKEEAAEIKKMLPLASSSPQARRQLYTILGNVADRQIRQFETANKSFTDAVQQDNPSLFQMGLEVYNPAPNQPQPTTQPKGEAPKVIRFEDM